LIGQHLGDDIVDTQLAPDRGGRRAAVASHVRQAYAAIRLNTSKIR
jgi:hypothetical protein